MATDNKFDQKQIAAKAGETTTISLVNHGTAVHNLHVAGLQGADGKDVQTKLIGGGETADATFTPSKTGTFKFQCDVHPAEMTGTLTVN